MPRSSDMVSRRSRNSACRSAWAAALAFIGMMTLGMTGAARPSTTPEASNGFYARPWTWRRSRQSDQ